MRREPLSNQKGVNHKYLIAQNYINAWWRCFPSLVAVPWHGEKRTDEILRMRKDWAETVPVNVVKEIKCAWAQFHWAAETLCHIWPSLPLNNSNNQYGSGRFWRHYSYSAKLKEKKGKDKQAQPSKNNCKNMLIAFSVLLFENNCDM